MSVVQEKLDGLLLKHALEVRNETFMTPEFAALVRKYNMAIVYAQHEDYPEIADVTGDFVYARLQKGSDDIKTCYPEKALDEWAARLKDWAGGGEPDDLPKIDPDSKPAKKPRDVFAFFITSGKVNAPNGARELQRRAG